MSVDDANPPYMYTRDGSPAGIYPAIVTAAFARMRTPVTLHAKPWVRVIQDMERGSTGGVGLYRNRERDKRFDFSEPILHETVLLYFNVSSPVAFATLGDLRGRTIGVLRGWSYGDSFDDAARKDVFKTDAVYTDAQNFQKLSRGRIDAILATKEAGDALLPLFGNISVAPKPILQNTTHLAFPKTADQKSVLRRFNEALKQLRREGQLTRIVQEQVQSTRYR